VDGKSSHFGNLKGNRKWQGGRETFTNHCKLF